MKPPRQAVGCQDEVSTTSTLEANGYGVSAGISPHGGIDIAASRDLKQVFVEVKTSPTLSFACPDASVTSRKQAHLPSEVETRLDQPHESGNTRQFDLPAVEGERGAKAGSEDCEYAIG